MSAARRKVNGEVHEESSVEYKKMKLLVSGVQSCVNLKIGGTFHLNEFIAGVSLLPPVYDLPGSSPTTTVSTRP